MIATISLIFLLIPILYICKEYMEGFDKQWRSKIVNSIAEKTLFSGLALCVNQFYAWYTDKGYFDLHLLGLSVPILVYGIILTKTAKNIGESKNE
jgi:hypothetical protein